tara:strand:+ start:1634 stop:2158 length:525 start_codon:yes stop_codon:yes gene_type:complete
MVKQYIKSFKDFPVDGVDFKDTASLCASVDGFREANDEFYAELLQYMPVDKIIGIDARGFIFGSVLAYRTSTPLVLARKMGKLPGSTIAKEFNLEYGTATLEIQRDSITKGESVIIIDDLMATGGTMNAVVEMVEELGAHTVAVACLMDLSFLPGGDSIRDKGIPFYAVTTYYY